MRIFRLVPFALIFLALVSCDQEAKIDAPEPVSASVTRSTIKAPTAAPQSVKTASVKQDAKIQARVPSLSEKGLNLIYEFETGGQRQYERNPHPELPDLRYSGVTVGIGYDLHQYSKPVIRGDWSDAIGQSVSERLAETQPYYGKSAVEPLKKVRDITISWGGATHVFLANDVAREFSAAKRAFPGFEDISLNCQSALIANGFARGYSTAGPNRTELRAIKELIPKRDYSGIASQLRKQERVWRGTSVYRGLYNRVYAEAVLAQTPDE